MSYILDALRRADAERELEKAAVPGLHTRPLPPPMPPGGDEPAARGPRRPVAAALAVLALAVVALAVVLVGRPRGEPPGSAAVPPGGGVLPGEPMRLPATVPQALPTPTGSDAAAVVPGAAAVVPSPAVSAAAAAAVEAPPRLVAPPAILSKPAPAIATPSRPIEPQVPTVDVLPRPRDPGRGADPPPAKRPSPPPRATATPSAAPPVRSPRAGPDAPADRVAPGLPSLRDLPGTLRAELPALVVAGSMYSSDPASRMIVVDGQVLREGQSLRADLVLERIGPRSAILSIRGQRFELPY